MIIVYDTAQLSTVKFQKPDIKNLDLYENWTFEHPVFGERIMPSQKSPASLVRFLNFVIKWSRLAKVFRIRMICKPHTDNAYEIWTSLDFRHLLILHRLGIKIAQKVS